MCGLRHFGTPLVESVDNFGVQGKQPVHPELLDWLATKLVSDQWSLKSLHRLIVTSQAYKRSSTVGSIEHANFGKDRDNVAYWHFPVRRMEAEVVRDSVLACAGVLDRTLGGPEIEVEHWVARPRRSLYFTQHGESQMQFLSTFDGANPCECYRRSSTVLPSQALALANSELLVHYGRLCAATLSRSLLVSRRALAPVPVSRRALAPVVEAPRFVSQLPSSSEQSDSNCLPLSRRALAPVPVSRRALAPVVEATTSTSPNPSPNDNPYGNGAYR